MGTDGENKREKPKSARNDVYGVSNRVECVFFLILRYRVPESGRFKTVSSFQLARVYIKELKQNGALNGHRPYLCVIIIIFYFSSKTPNVKDVLIAIIIHHELLSRDCYRYNY